MKSAYVHKPTANNVKVCTNPYQVAKQDTHVTKDGKKIKLGR